MTDPLSTQSDSACIIACCRNPACSRKPEEDWPLPVHVVRIGSHGGRFYEPDNPADELCPDCGQRGAWITY